MEKEDSTQSFLDQLHKLEKLGIVENSNLWNQFRHVRNTLSHEYPDDPASIAKGLNECAEMCKVLLCTGQNI